MSKNKTPFVAGILGTVLAALLACLPNPVRGQDDGGFKQTHLRLISTGAVHYRGAQVQFFLATLKSPHVDTAGTVLAAVPRVDFRRDAEGKPIIVVSHPTRGGPVLLTGADGRKYPAKASDVAQAVQSGRLSPDTPVSVTIELRLDHSEELQKIVFEAARSQLTRQVEKSGAAFAPLTSGDWERLRNNVIWPTVREFRVTAAGEGLKDVAFVLSENPALEEYMRLQTIVRALFISRLYSDEGVQLIAKFVQDVYLSGGAWGEVEKTVEDVLRIQIKESSLGHLKLDDKQGVVEILATRRQAQEMVRRSRWKESTKVVGDPETINVVLQMLQRQDADIFRVTEDQMESWLKEHQVTLQMLREDGVANTLESLSQKDHFSDQDVESFKTILKASEKHGQGGGAASLFGVVSLGGGGGSSEASTEASKEQNRRALQEFVKDLNIYRKNGRFPVPRSGHYAMLSEQAIRRTVAQYVSIITGGSIKALTLSSPFSSIQRTLGPQGPTTPSAGSRERRAAERAEARAKRALEQAKRAAGHAENEFRDRQAALDAAATALTTAVTELNTKSAAYDEKRGQHDAAINKPPAAYHGCSAAAKMAWDAHCWKELRPAAQAWTNAIQAVSGRYCPASQSELVQAKAALTAALTAYRDKLAQHEAALNKTPQAYHRCSVGDKLAWDAHTWKELKAASEVLTAAVSSFQGVAERTLAAQRSEAEAARSSARRAVLAAENEVDRCREALEDPRP